jgi:hypothetical protein
MKKTPTEDILKNEKIGNVITDQLSAYLTTYTSNKDALNISATSQVGYSTIRQVRSQSLPLTEKNSTAIMSLVKLAIDNCKNTSVNALEAIVELEKLTV